MRAKNRLRWGWSIHEHGQKLMTSAIDIDFDKGDIDASRVCWTRKLSDPISQPNHRPIEDGRIYAR